jgi:arginyl-tRNA synthetase
MVLHRYVCTLYFRPYYAMIGSMFSTIREIETAVAETLKELGIKRPNVILEHPADMGHGDYATNVALVYGKKLGMSPLEVAREIVAGFNKKTIIGLDRVEIAGFGFINFYLSPEFFSTVTKEILQTGEKYGAGKTLRGQKVVIEYTDANPFKEFHVGHMMSNAIGESLSRLIAFQEAEVKRVCYQGDVGLHIAKSIFGLKQNKWQFWKNKFFGTSLSKAHFLGQAYALGAKNYEDNETVKEEIIQINKAIYLKNDATVKSYYDLGRQWSLDYFDYIYKILGTKFDKFFFESETAEIGKNLVEEYLDKDVFEVSGGKNMVCIHECLSTQRVYRLTRPKSWVWRK